MVEGFGLSQFADETAGHVEMLAGNWAAAETSFRSIYDRLHRGGERASFPTIAAYLAETLHAQDRDDEALLVTKVSESAAASDDVVSQMLWRATRAKVLARRGDVEEAMRLAHEAVRLGDDTEMLNERAATHVDLAEVLIAADVRHEATAAIEEGLRLFEEKGNIVGADAARNRLKRSGWERPA